MASHFLLYTVTGGREVFYAAVDRETERVWTSPTKEGALRQAQDAGMGDNFTERMISKSAFLESMGVVEDHHSLRPADHQEHVPREEAPKSPTSWFAPGEGHVEPMKGSAPLPRRLKSGKKPLKGKSPFAARPISAGEEEDVLLSGPEHPPEETPFTDEPPQTT